MRASSRRRGSERGDPRAVRNEKDPSTIVIQNDIGKRYRRVILAQRGIWIVHRGIGSDWGYTLTHEPTRRAASVRIDSLERATQVAAAMNRLPGDWTFTDMAALTMRQVRAAKAIKKKFGVF